MSAHAMHIAIDVGTARTAAAIAVTGADGVDVRAVRLGQSGDAASSAVFVADDGLVFGDAAERRAVADPARLLRETKRRIGDDIPLLAAGRSFRAEQLHAATVAWALETVTAQESDPVASITVTVPAAWAGHRLRAVTDALAERGIDASVVTEPEAAAAHYAASRDVPPGSVLAVYDFGGGTFDLAFVRHTDTGDEVIHTAGAAELGGADFDDAVFAHVVESLPVETPVGSDPVALSVLRRECVAAKEALSFDPEASIPVLHCGASIRLVRSEFETMIDREIAQTVDVFARAKDEAQIADADIHAILLSGGSSRIPRVVQQVSDAFDLPLRVDADPKAVVALGAARWGALRTQSLAPAIAPVAAAPLDMPPRWRILVAATAACATILGGAAVTTSLAAAAPETQVAAAAGGPTALLDALSSWHAGDSSAQTETESVPDPGAPPALVDPAAPTPIPAPPLFTAPPARIPATLPAPRAKTTPPPRSATPVSPATQTASTPGSGSASVPTGTTPVRDAGPQPTTPPQPTTAPEPQPTTVPEPEPTTDPTPEPTTAPEPEPTTTPEPEPTADPTPEPTSEPSPDPTPEPSPNVPVAE